MAAPDRAPRHRAGTCPPSRLPDPGAEGPVAARGGRPARRAGPGRVLDARGVPRRLPAARGRRPRVPRRRGPDPGRPVPRPQGAGGLRLRPPAVPQTRGHRPPGHPGLRHRQRERRVPRPARHRQDPPGHRAGIRACQAGHRVAFATAAEWVARLADAHHAGRLQDELTRLGRYPLLVIDEVGYIPFEPEAANLFFQLVSSRYERASLIVTSNKPFGRWGEVFGDDVVAAAMIDRLVHHAEVIALKETATASKTATSAASPRPPKLKTINHRAGWSIFNRRRGSTLSRR